MNTLLKRELLDHLTSMRFPVILVICLILLPVSFSVNHQDYRQRLADYNSAVNLHREKMATSDVMEFVNGVYSVNAYRPPSPLSVFVKGLEDEIPSAYFVKRIDFLFQYSDPGRRLTMALSGGIDFLFLVQVLFSLIAILVTYDAVCGEKESGTLRAVLANPIPRSSIILGKFIGAMSIITIPFFISLLVGLIMLSAQGFPLRESGIPLRIGGIVAVALVYMAAFCCLGLFVSSRTRNSKTAVVLLLVLWVMVIYIIPKLGSIAATSLRPVRLEEVFAQEQRLAVHHLELEQGKRLHDIWDNIPIDGNMPKEERQKRTMEHIKLAQPIRAEYARRIGDLLAKTDDAYERENQRQQSLALSIARLSPMSLLGTISTELAWTSFHERKRFTAEARVFRNIIRRDLFSYIDVFYYPGGGSGMSFNRPPDFTLSALPEFRYSRASLTDTLILAGLDIILLVIIGLGAFALAYVSFLKYDVR